MASLRRWRFWSRKVDFSNSGPPSHPHPTFSPRPRADGRKTWPLAPGMELVSTPLLARIGVSPREGKERLRPHCTTSRGPFSNRNRPPPNVVNKTPAFPLRGFAGGVGCPYFARPGRTGDSARGGDVRPPRRYNTPVSQRGPKQSRGASAPALVQRNASNGSGDFHGPRRFHRREFKG